MTPNIPPALLHGLPLLPRQAAPASEHHQHYRAASPHPWLHTHPIQSDNRKHPKPTVMMRRSSTGVAGVMALRDREQTRACYILKMETDPRQICPPGYRVPHLPSSNTSTNNISNSNTSNSIWASSAQRHPHIKAKNPNQPDIRPVPEQRQGRTRRRAN